MSDLNCEYHSSRTAIDKCTRCNRLICLEDKNYISHGRSYHRSSSRYSYSTYNNIVLCSMCYYDAAVEGKNLMASSMNVMRKFIIIVPLIMILLPIFVPLGPNVFLFSVYISLICLVSISTYILINNFSLYICASYNYG